MNNNDIDVNLLIQSFTEKISQLTYDNIVKDTIIKQLTIKLESLESKKEDK